MTRSSPQLTPPFVDRPTADKSALAVSGIRKRYGDREVLRDVTFDVPEGRVLALLGPNGAGKTTLIRILTTLVRADGGTARLLGHDVVRDRARVRELISVTGQYASVDEELTGRENLVMVGRLLRLGKSEALRRADELLEEFDLTAAAHRRVGHYSGGMRRRLDLAASLVASPPLIFLDEPTTGMDTRSRAALWNVVTRLARGGRTIILTTQYLEEADVLADRIAVLDGGAIVASGTAAELKKRVGRETVELVLDDGAVIRSVTDGNPERVRLLLNRLHSEGRHVRTLTVQNPTLDDAFLALTGHSTATAPTDKEPAR
ncbi:ATP-binding cassette domain-containing protein [Actinoalloteichus caeruleus]|uniref:ABC-2 type transport system ATP-binding protein n=1 Tax=Actinoalloteichus caeruleus DSM 43889 TaxID=1120930 RepID=A0ABT1JF68_ACTCY|nr:ATP-binding cassette domain-containing protein [Actinoalloteichus caeruleus]MCP2330823.1 ABC-2 type transport system ATP-binding protein [Actinoalloteichus caeruleus DSM 43889]